MRKYLPAIIVVLCSVSRARAATFGDFNSLVNGAALKPFVLDLGGILGGAAFHSGRSLGMPGFDAGVVGTIQFRPDKDDVILRGPGVKAFGLPMVQAEAGLPLNVDVIIHGVTGQGARVLGAGLRYGVHKSGMLSVLPDVAVSAFWDKVDQTYFSAVHYSINAAASFHLPIVHPYLGIGEDITTVKVGTVVQSTAVGISQKAEGSRLAAGLVLSPFPFVQVHGAYTLLHGLSGANVGLGVQF